MSETKIDRYYFKRLAVKFFRPGDDAAALAEAMRDHDPQSGTEKRLAKNAIEFAKNYDWKATRTNT